MSAEPIHVLLVEDNPADADLVSELVADVDETGSIDIVPVGSLAAARERLARGGLDVALLDLQLPDSEGIATVESMRAATHGLPFVVLTGTRDEATAIAALHAGAQDYLIKGRFDGSTLLRAVRYAIERQRLTRELDELREVFAAVVAHDLRNPIHSATLHIGFLIREMDQKLEKTEDVSRMLTHARQTLVNLKRIAEMVNDLMDTARIELDRIDLERETLRLVPAVSAIAERLRPSVGERRLDVVIEGQPPDVDAEPRRFDQILTNLVDNAAKHSPDGSTIRIAVRAADGGATIAITDEGPGIPAEELDKLFDRFYQARRARKKTQGRGLGLGLYITQGLVRAHGGSISVESRPGKGSTFTVWLPRAAASAS